MQGYSAAVTVCKTSNKISAPNCKCHTFMQNGEIGQKYMTLKVHA